jgi:hypothetical protein
MCSKLQFGLAHRTVRCARLVLDELAALGIRRRRTAIIHRTVRWCTGLSGESTVASANGRPRNLRGTRGCSNGQLGAPDSVRCAIWPEGATVGCARFGRKSCTGQATVVVRSTEGKDSLPCWPSTTPRCLGAIKENPRRMEE